ncbi:O-Antigen ligase [Sphaerochaeta associata]|nr:O-Antigen ligase [Sphaerochaeta associata]
MIKSSQTSKNRKFSNRLYDFVMILFLVFFIAFANVRPAYVIIEIVFIGVFLIRAFTRNMRLEFYAYWSIAYLLVGLVSAIFSSYITVSFQMLISTIQVLVVTNLLLPYIRDNERNCDLFQIGIILAIASLGIRLIVTTPFSSLGLMRAGSSIGYNANEFGFIFAYGTTVLSYLFLENRKKIYLPIIVVFSILCLLSGSRTALAVMLISFSIQIIGHYTQQGDILKFIKGIFFLGVILILLIILITQNEVLYDILGRRVVTFFESLTGRETSEGSTLIRLSMISDALDLFVKKPLLGSGLNTFRIYSGYGTYSHNNYTELLVSIGLVGIFIYYSLFIWLLIKVIRLYKTTKEGKYICVVALVFAALIGDLGTVSYYSESLYVIWLFFVSLIDRKSINSRKMLGVSY